MNKLFCSRKSWKRELAGCIFEFEKLLTLQSKQRSKVSNHDPRVSRDSSLCFNPQRIFLDICMIRPFYVGRKTFDDMLIATINVTIGRLSRGHNLCLSNID